MWRAIVKSKGVDVRGTYVDVDFTDGVTTVSERCNPQNIEGLKHWVRGRLSTFNVESELNANYGIGTEIPPVDEQPAKSTEEIAREVWFNDFRKMERVQKLIDLGIILATNTKVVALKDKLKAGLKPEYIDAL